MYHETKYFRKTKSTIQYANTIQKYKDQHHHYVFLYQFNIISRHGLGNIRRGATFLDIFLSGLLPFTGNFEIFLQS